MQVLGPASVAAQISLALHQTLSTMLAGPSGNASNARAAVWPACPPMARCGRRAQRQRRREDGLVKRVVEP